MYELGNLDSCSIPAEMASSVSSGTDPWALPFFLPAPGCYERPTVGPNLPMAGGIFLSLLDNLDLETWVGKSYKNMFVFEISVSLLLPTSGIVVKYRMARKRRMARRMEETNA